MMPYDTLFKTLLNWYDRQMDNTNPKVTLRLKIRMNIVCENSSSSYIKLFPNLEISLELKYKDRTVSGNIKDNCSLLKVYHCK